MRKSSLIVLFLLLSSICAQAQSELDWIDFSQSYYKIKVVEDDFYRVTRDELLAVGFPISSVSASKLQLFRRGEEVAISVDANNDNTLNYFEFYGKAIDGTGDAPLYASGNQPNQHLNLFSDTATYFLTYKLGGENGKRMSFSSDNDATGLTPEPFHVEDATLFYRSRYATGTRFGTGAEFTLSEYDNGEGWTGPSIRKNGFTNHEFTLENRVSGQDPVCEIVLVGGNSLDHRANISAGPEISNLSAVNTTLFEGWGYTQNSFNIPEANLGANGELAINVVREGFPEAADFFSVSYVSIRYPQAIQVESNENKLFTLDAPSSAKAYLQIGTANPTATSIFDVNDPANPVRIAKRDFTDRIDVVIPNVEEGHEVLAVTTAKNVVQIQSVTLSEPDVADRNYLVITHNDLRKSGDRVGDYKSYRESEAGGGYRVQISAISDLYDLFNYGDPSPIAVRNFIQHASLVSTIEYVFIIGKGFTPDIDYFRGDQSAVNIPTFGLPGSDLMYTLGMNGAGPSTPGIPIGRLNAFSPEDVTAYLDKVIEMEALPYDDLWRKDFLQLSGGNTQSELNLFASYIQHFGTLLEGDFIGGRAFNTGKETGGAVEFVNVTDRVNEGVGYVTFFGHSGGNSTDIEIGRVSDSEFGFSNKAKYPIFLVNGCKAGEIFGTNFTFGEDWMITPDLGAIGFIAHADFATASTLRRWSNLFHQVAYQDNAFIGESVGNILIEVSKRYFNQHGIFNSSLTQVQQMLYEGDPAYRLFGADYPDYHIDNASLFATPSEGAQVLATHDFLKINIIVKNFGRTVADSLAIQLDRQFANGTSTSYFQKYLRPLRLDTLEFIVPNDPLYENAGQNLFTVTLDPDVDVTELSRANNVANLEVSIFNGLTAHLFPIDHATVNADQVEMVWQTSNLLEGERSFDLEVDTEPTFDSPNWRQFTISGELLLKNSVDFSQFSLPDSSAIYWRTRLSDPTAEENNMWVTSTFTIVNAIPEGWGQYEPAQLDDSSVQGVEYNETSGQWEFIQTVTPIDVSTFGADHPTFIYEDIEAIVGGIDFMVSSNANFVCRQNTLNAIAFDKESGDPYRPISTNTPDRNNSEVCGRGPQRIYNFTEEDLQTNNRLQILLDNMENGDQIVLFSIGNITYSDWNAPLRATLNAVGVSTATIDNLADGQAIIFFGQKGATPGAAVEIVTDGSITPVTQQSIGLEAEASGSFSSGTFQTDRIGPAKDWTSFSFNLSEENNDSYSINVIGIDQNGMEVNLPEFERGRAETIDVSMVDSQVYPELKLQFSFSDDVDLTPPQLNFWELNYQLPPDGILLSENKEISSYQEGEIIDRPLAFHNFSEDDFTDSLDVELRLVNQNSGNSQVNTIKIAPPTAGDSTAFTSSFSSIGYGGMNSLIVNVSANENEAYDFNNRLILMDKVEVEADETNPILDVTFDGNHILDGDIVSPTPTISVRVRDSNPYLFKDDTLGITLSIKLPGEGNTFQRINFSNPALTFTGASETQDMEINYVPDQLENGIYGLRVNARDETGNETGTEPYEVNFEIVNESTVTHFYPYPNPFSTSCRFVFTLTGNEIPDQIKIQVLTVSGRVVREITQDQIGPVRIGNNITEYAWDGTDDYGDQLANGVYFYRVFLNSNGQAVDQRATSADRAFKNGFGKLYILR